MGFDSGKLIGNVEQQGACSDFNSKNYCGKPNSNINLKDVNCDGTESSLSECASIFSPNDCTHDADVIISCEGI